MTKEETAVQKRNCGYNCAQAVACTYAEEFGMDEKTMFRVTEGLGTGLGTTRGTCGALNAACLLAGMKRSSANLEKPDSRAFTYQLTRKLVSEFENQAGAVRCMDIKGIGTGRVLCECEDCVRIACRLTEKYITEEN
ncbi:MAG: C-GCAxxG-C-C family protein [Solobacterium sp.]|nr:C-GCAxxG-C-C family protein [Solobacterium sp.]